MEKILIFGASGHAKVVVDIVEKEKKYQIAGIIDNTLTKGSTLLGYTVLGNDDDVPDLIAKHLITGALFAIGDNFQRNKVTARILEASPNISLVVAIHPNAIIAKEACIARGSVVMAGSILGPSSSIGEGCIVNTHCSLDHDSSMGEFSSLAPGTTTGGNVSVGAYSAIGINTTISHNITIGEHSVIGADSTVLRDIPSYQIAYGTPAKPIHIRQAGDTYL